MGAVRPEGEPILYLHRDLSPDNVLCVAGEPCPVDWDMTHPGLAIDDLAAVVCCQGEATSPRSAVDVAVALTRGHAKEADRALSFSDPMLRSAVALAAVLEAFA